MIDCLLARTCMSLACYRVEFLCCCIVYTAARVDCVTSQFRNRVYTVEVDQAKYAYRHRTQEVRLRVRAQLCATVRDHASQPCVAVRLNWPCCYFFVYMYNADVRMRVTVYMRIVCCV